MAISQGFIRLASIVLVGIGGAMSQVAGATDGYFMNGVGAKAKGSGGVAIALPQEASAIAVNPAAATELGHELSIGADLFIPERSARISGNAIGLDGAYDGNGANPFVLGDVAYVQPLSANVSAGIVAYANGGMNTVYRDNPYAAMGGAGAAGIDLKQGFVMPTIAVRIAPGQSLGVSAVGLVQTFRASGIAPFASASQAPDSFSDRGTDWSIGAGFKLGYLGRFGPLSLGAFYQSKTWASKFKRYKGLFADGGSFDVPASWGAGLAIEASENLTVAFDYKRIEYAGVRSVAQPIASLSHGQPFGAKEGPGFGWRSIDVFKTGAVFQATDRLKLRVGYGRSGNPVPRSDTLLNILAPGIVQDHYTLGASLAVRPGMDLTFHAMRAPRRTVSGVRSIPANFGGGEADISLAETSAGLGVAFSL